MGVTSDREFTLLRYPIETASLSEAGAEKKRVEEMKAYYKERYQQDVK